MIINGRLKREAKKNRSKSAHDIKRCFFLADARQKDLLSGGGCSNKFVMTNFVRRKLAKNFHETDSWRKFS